MSENVKKMVQGITSRGWWFRDRRLQPTLREIVKCRHGLLFRADHYYLSVWCLRKHYNSRFFSQNRFSLALESHTCQAHEPHTPIFLASLPSLAVHWRVLEYAKIRIVLQSMKTVGGLQQSQLTTWFQDLISKSSNNAITHNY